MLKKRPANWNLYFSEIALLLAIVASMLSVGFRRSVLRPAVEGPPLGSVTYPAAGLLLMYAPVPPALFFRTVVPLRVSAFPPSLTYAASPSSPPFRLQS